MSGNFLLTAGIDWRKHKSLTQENIAPIATLSTDAVYQLHIRLAHIEPLIWRRIVVSGQVMLFC